MKTVHRLAVIVACLMATAAIVTGHNDRATQFLCFAILFRTFILEERA